MANSVECTSRFVAGDHQHGKHYLPFPAIWLTTITTGLIAAITNFVMVLVDVKLITWKFDAMQQVITNNGVGAGVFTLAAFAVLYSGVATNLVCWIAPMCAGSGLPEAKGYLNGNKIQGMFDIRTFCVRVLGIIFSTGSGFPAGREGPMVCIGGFIGYKAVETLARVPFISRFFDVELDHPDEHWFGEEVRLGSTIGSAAGVATAFNAPIGGILYMLEEATVTSWAQEATFRALVCSAVGIFVSRLLLNASGSDFHRLVIFEPDSVSSHISWDWIDVPFFVLLAACVGTCAAAFTHALIFVWKARRKLDARLAQFQPYVKIIAAVSYALLCALVMALIPLAFDCVSAPSDDHHRRLGGGGGLVFVRYDCPEGKHNALATLLLNPGEGTVKHLYARSGAMLTLGPLVVAVLVYGILAMGMPGLAVPMGNFIPSMVIGSLIGRFLGEALDASDQLHGEIAHPGVYAMVGSAAMLGGFTHMTIAIVALLTEAGHDISLVPLLMLSIFVAHLFSHHLNHVGYDERLIVLKDVPFLHPHVPKELDSPDATARCICEVLPKDAHLSEHASPQQLQAALDSGDFQGFPVVGADGTCIGIVERPRLASALSHQAHLLQVKSVLCREAFRILEDMPAIRFYPLFAKGVTELACVVNRDGEFCGMLSRRSIFAEEKRRHGRRKEILVAAISDSPKDSELKQCEPHTHRISLALTWAITFVIAVVVAITNYCMVYVDVKLVTWKFDAVQSVIGDSDSVALGFLTLAAFSLLFSAVATCLVCLVAPICAGSGLPEAKGYLNGNQIPKMFEFRTFFVRVLGIIFSTAAGYPAGREGPMVCIGGFIGEKVTHYLVLPWVQQWVNADASQEHLAAEALLQDEEFFVEAKRVGATLGGAAGVAVAFNAPIGGILYMFEEATVASWSDQITFHAVVIAAVGALVSRALLNVTKADFHRLVIFEDSEQVGVSWGWIDVPFFILLAAVGGSCAAAFTRVLVFVWKLRRKLHGKAARLQPFAKIAECLFYAVLCSVFFSLIPMAFECVSDGQSAHGSSDTSGSSSNHRRLGGGAGLVFSQYDCSDGQHNTAATLLLNAGEGSVKHLVSRSGSNLELGPLVVVLAVYGLLAMGMAGLAVPMGNFIPSMLIGSLLGRILGEALHKSDALQKDLAHPGVYAMVGSAAMLGGFTHMSIAIVVLLTEAGHDITLVSPLMVSIFVAHFFSKIGNHHGYDEILILLKGVHYLEPEVPHDLDTKHITAVDLCNDIPMEARLPLVSTKAFLQNALSIHDSPAYPVLKPACNSVIGVVGAARLRSLVLPGNSSTKGAHRHNRDDEHSFAGVNDVELHVIENLVKELSRRSLTATGLSADSEMLNMQVLMDPIPFEIIEDMPADVTYQLFALGVTKVACVVSKSGHFRGVLSRLNFMSDFMVSRITEVRESHEAVSPKSVPESAEISRLKMHSPSPPESEALQGDSREPNVDMPLEAVEANFLLPGAAP